MAEAPPASSCGGVDRLSSLPDEILAQILSFLPAHVAARTCVLARSWCGVWKLTRRLRITGTAEPESVREARGFADHLLGLRLREIERAPFNACEITFRDYDDSDEDDVRRWIGRAVECQVQVLRIDLCHGESNYFSQRGSWLWCYVFRRDLRWCPTFWKLKTLVLNDYWCEPAGCCAIASILEHAPVLEILTILFALQVQPKYKVEIEGRLDTTEESSLISRHLKIVKVKCGKVDERVLDVLNFLGTLNIWFHFRRMG